MGLANERLHAAAKSGDVEQLQVTGYTRSYRAVRPMLDQAAGLRLLQLWLGTGAELTHQDGYGTPLARVDDLSMRFAVNFRSAALVHGTRHTHWLVSLSTPATRRLFSRERSSPPVTAACVVRGMTVLALAAVAGHSPVVALLIDAGADLNAQCDEGYGPCADCSVCAPSERASRVVGRSTALIGAAMYSHTLLSPAANFSLQGQGHSAHVGRV
jgi:hypothetical protein